MIISMRLNIQYQVFDDNITLGKVSKMSNSQLIKIGKKQDRKYFDKSADEVRALRDGKSQIGLQDDLMGDSDLKGDFNKGAWICLERGTKHYKRLVPIDDYQRESTERALDRNVGFDKFTEFQTVEYGAPRNASEQVDELQNYIRNKRFKWILKNTKGVKYLQPKWQTLKFKNTTDASGNKIVSQKMKFKSIDEFNDAGTMDENLTKNLTASQKQKIVAMKESGNHSNFDEHVRSAFDDAYYKAVTKDVFKPNAFNDEWNLTSTVHQKIYNSNYIGYSLENGDDLYLVTKAQNNRQRAAFAK